MELGARRDQRRAGNQPGRPERQERADPDGPPAKRCEANEDPGGPTTTEQRAAAAHPRPAQHPEGNRAAPPLRRGRKATQEPQRKTGAPRRPTTTTPPGARPPRRGRGPAREPAQGERSRNEGQAPPRRGAAPKAGGEDPPEWATKAALPLKEWTSTKGATQRPGCARTPAGRWTGGGDPRGEGGGAAQRRGEGARAPAPLAAAVLVWQLPSFT